MNTDNSDKSKKEISSNNRGEGHSMGNSKKKSSKKNLKDGIDAKLNAKNELKIESKLHIIIDAMPAMIGYVNTDYRFEFANKYLKNLTGFDSSLVIGKHIEDVIGEKGFAKVKPIYEKVFAGERQEFEIIIPMPNGKLTPIHGIYIPHKVNGKIDGAFILGQDISKLRRN